MKISKKFDHNVPLTKDELDNYIWEKLRINDEDHDDDAIKEKFKRFYEINKKDPLGLKADFIKWNSPAGENWRTISYNYYA